MSYRIIVTEVFKKQLKKIYKRQRSIKQDVQQLIESLEQNPFQGTTITESVYKIRMSVSSSGKGKSGGVRIITYLMLREQELYLISIYNKSKQDSISKDMIVQILKKLDLPL
jgi:mRNA-degrading endonuclease RelE of RelBE toxin-antitoxin system